MSTRYSVALLALLLPAVTFAQSKTDRAALFLESEAAARGITSAEVMVTDAVEADRSGVTHVYLRQSVGGIGIVGTEATVSLDRMGQVRHAAGADRLTPAASSVSKNASAALSASDAAEALARHTGISLSTLSKVSDAGTPDRVVRLADARGDETPVRLVYAPDASGRLHLAWEVELNTAGQLWMGYVDAATGEILDAHDLVVYEDFGHAPEASSLAPLAKQLNLLPSSAMVGSYLVYPMPLDSPYEGGRSAVANPDNAAASPFGWHDTNGASGAEYTTTRGNNVHAYLDRNDSESPDGPLPDGGAALTFAPALNLSQDPVTYTDASIVNLFYWNNIIHDVLVQYGFDEASGNFQATNYSGAPGAGDAVDAESQSGADICNEVNPCRNNANFATPSDGSRPRMQMYIGTNPNPDVDGSFDNGVVVHEYGHGISNRLTGGRLASSCLRNGEQMGEGWSDYYGLMLTMKTGDSGTDARAIGNYLFGYGPNGGGIRLAPYSTNFGVNGYTYGDTRQMSAVHQIGFTWATILWEVTWDMINAHGFSTDLYNGNGTAGNQIMLRLVTEGMKYQPCSPGFVDGRDGILAAEQAIYGGAYASTLQAAFARRGLGYSANQGSSSRTTDNVEAFDAWPGGGGGNTAPSAAFSASCAGLTCSFTDASSDADGTIASRAWTFGDGATSSATNPSRTYGASGTYTVTLTVTDNEGATDSASQSVTAQASGGNPISLTVTTSTHRRKGNQAILSWSPADGGRVDVFLNGSSVARTKDDGNYARSVSGNGPFTFQVCETDSGDCSNEETVSFLAVDGFADGATVDTDVTVFPNPLRDMTTIRFGLAEEGEVSLVVFNSVGQEVAVLARGHHGAGTHDAIFDAAPLPAGVYIYRLVTGAEVQTGRLSVVR